MRTDGLDMEANRILYIHYISVVMDGEELALARSLMGLSVGRFIYTIDGKDYSESGLLMNTGTQLFLTALVVPAETPDDVEVTARYQ